MLISEAQGDLRRAYVGGGPGVMVSGLVWLVAALVQRAQGIGPGFIALFFGGMLIFPVSKLICRFAFGRANEAGDNPFGMTVMEVTIAMIGGLFAAWLFLASMPALVLPLAAVAVGTHYFAFKTAYGNRAFWLLAASITMIGLGGIFVAIVELTFGSILTVAESRKP